uniref:Uncharacterized protein n=1 Tax=Arundo donax TaxID=35708 RepID=A0A0A9E0V7_ARUDO
MRTEKREAVATAQLLDAAAARDRKAAAAWPRKVAARERKGAAGVARDGNGITTATSFGAGPVPGDAAAAAACFGPGSGPGASGGVPPSTGAPFIHRQLPLPRALHQRRQPFVSSSCACSFRSCIVVSFPFVQLPISLFKCLNPGRFSLSI